MSDAVAEIRSGLGASAALWAGPDGVAAQERGWTAFSGARSVDYNVVLVSGDGDELDAGVERILAAGVPAVLMVAGPALGEVQRLVARSWVCIGATPVMSLALGEVDLAPGGSGARRLTAGELDAARSLVADVFEVGPELAQVAMPTPVGGRDPEHAVWGAFDEAGRLRSCLALVSVGESVAVWSMATAVEAQGRGYGARALSAALAHAANEGARTSILYASPAGEPFYRRLGYREIERWQMWSRPRWVLGRA